MALTKFWARALGDVNIYNNLGHESFDVQACKSISYFESHQRWRYVPKIIMHISKLVLRETSFVCQTIMTLF